MNKLLLNLGILVILLTPHFAFANMGGRVGNGGGLVVCRDSATQAIKSVELLDFYEARTFRGKNLDLQNLTGNWKARLLQIINRMQTLSPLRVQIYTDFLTRFDGEAQFASGVQFSTIPDTGFIAVPNGCEFEQGVFQSQPLFTGETRYFINNEVWQAMDDSQRAGLIFHEFLYREAIGYGHTDSVTVRYLNGEIADQAFPTMTQVQWHGLLTQAKYEMTDEPTNTTWGFQANAKIDVTQIWLPAPGESVPPYSLTNRLPTLLGICSHGDGCQTFTSPSALQRTDAINTTVYQNFLHPILAELDYQNENYILPAKTSSSPAIYTGISTTDPIGRITKLGWITYVNQSIAKIFVTAKADQSSTNSISGNIYDVYFGSGAIAAIGFSNIIATNYNFHSNDPCAEYLLVYEYGKYFNLYAHNLCSAPLGPQLIIVGSLYNASKAIDQILLNPTDNSTPVAQFDISTGNYVSGGVLKSLGIGNIFYVCGHNSSGCFSTYSFHDPLVWDQLSFTEEFSILLNPLNQSPLHLQNEFVAGPQDLDLYPTAIPKSVVISKDAPLVRKKDGTIVSMPAGTTVNFDQDGNVL